MARRAASRRTGIDQRGQQKAEKTQRTSIKEKQETTL
jgi:hypothetical protein